MCFNNVLQLFEKPDAKHFKGLFISGKQLLAHTSSIIQKYLDELFPTCLNTANVA